jgi:hypothetical protein
MDEVDMLNGWLGQLSDGAGENKRWTTPYWKNLSFDTTGITIQNENAKPFKGKTDKAILANLADRFEEITDEYTQFCEISEYFDDKRSEDLNLGITVANSIIKKFSGDNEDMWDLYTQEDFDEMEKKRAEVDAMAERCKQGVFDLYKSIALMEGKEPPKSLEDCLWKPEDGDFYEKLKELDDD